MEVILLQRVDKLGKMGDRVTVSKGFARNFLVPQQKACYATEENVAEFEKRKAELEALNLKHKEEAEMAAKAVEGLSISLVRQASETGLLFGSVSARDIALSIQEKGHSTLTHQMIKLEKPIKEVGIHVAHLQLHPEVIVDVMVSVAKSEEEAALQLAKATAKSE